MTPEAKNDRTKLGFHRVVARLLPCHPEWLCEARSIADAWASDPDAPTFALAWSALLARPLPEVRRAITRRGPEAARLRTTSPFYLLARPVLPTEQDRRRLRERMTRCLRPGRQAPAGEATLAGAGRPP